MPSAENKGHQWSAAGHDDGHILSEAGRHTVGELLTLLFVLEPVADFLLPRDVPPFLGLATAGDLHAVRIEAATRAV